MLEIVLGILLGIASKTWIDAISNANIWALFILIKKRFSSSYKVYKNEWLHKFPDESPSFWRFAKIEYFVSFGILMTFIVITRVILILSGKL